MERMFINRHLHRTTPLSEPDPDVRDFHRQLPEYQVTPLRQAERLADRLGVGTVLVKDESMRLGLPAFKILGASWAFNRILAARFQVSPDSWKSFEELQDRVRTIPHLTLVTATDGNHGRAVARVAAWFGCGARIFVPRGTVPARIRAIESEVAEVIVVDGGYDRAVEAAAAEEGTRTMLIQDTAWPGYETVPRWIVDGYSTIFLEIAEQLKSTNAPEPDGIFIQIGVGSLAASAVQFYRCPGRQSSPRIIGVEPETAACAFKSVMADRMVSVQGPHESIMAGLNCGTLSSVAWPLLCNGINAFLTVDDETAVEAMRLLAADGIVSGESGAAGAAGMLALCDSPTLGSVRDELGIGRNSTVLLLSTEGATDPEMYHRIISDTRSRTP